MRRVSIICALSVILIGAVALVAWEQSGPITAEQKEYESYAHRDGKKEAEQDISQGVLKWKILGRVSDFEARRADLKAALNLELDWFAGCLVTEDIERYRVDYNTTVRSYLVSLHGEKAIHDELGDPPKLDAF